MCQLESFTEGRKLQEGRRVPFLSPILHILCDLSLGAVALLSTVALHDSQQQEGVEGRALEKATQITCSR